MPSFKLWTIPLAENVTLWIGVMFGSYIGSIGVMFGSYIGSIGCKETATLRIAELNIYFFADWKMAAITPRQWRNVLVQPTEQQCSTEL
jgi:hypothetical protein